MNLDMWVTCFVASWIFSLSPGAGSVFSMTNGLNYGFKRGYFGVIGLVLGLWIVFLAVVVGLGAIIQASPLAFNILKWAGVAYLFYLGLDQWRSKGSPVKVKEEHGTPVSIMSLIAKGVALNVVNPKGYIFMLAVIPQFIEYSAPLTPQYLIIAMTFAFTDLVVMAGYTGLAAKALVYLKTEAHMSMLNKVFGALFMAAAMVLATFHQVHQVS
ncbi:homoserine/homoserine lactone efflux protein [Limnobacter thiooxidans]|uniref:LysE family transporter n=1 Tax=Limnobacter thiooxidans TaxID=131080 RepID=A0AA86J8M8_9BURK|nr:LysE family transporter [Limnobacter sp.]MCZ8014916.1 LysE family transporter [Limnobacter sp.]RZS40441.1 homoserine/homoserine lactone efflux protein [Limnobacter thiooxidans]BET27125.1 LysE family transporter [Limnobacter thiooxidans]